MSETIARLTLGLADVPMALVGTAAWYAFAFAL
jgi:hypothetical protein